jgi:two-component system cell cycle response regulator CtrA
LLCHRVAADSGSYCFDAHELKIIDVFICKLRKKLANASNGKNYIETVWGCG